MVQMVRKVPSWADYIVGMDHHLFRNVYVQDTRNN